MDRQIDNCSMKMEAASLLTCERTEIAGKFWLTDRLLAMRKLLLGVGVLSLLSGDVMKLIFVVEEKEGGPGEGWF